LGACEDRSVDIATPDTGSFLERRTTTNVGIVALCLWGWTRRSSQSRVLFVDDPSRVGASGALEDRTEYSGNVAWGCVPGVV
jgi:hypothetical protein